MRDNMAIDDVRNEIVKIIKSNNISHQKMQQLFAIFFNDDEVWATRTEHLVRRVITTYDAIRLEEAGRIVIDPWLCFDDTQQKYFIFGG